VPRGVPNHFEARRRVDRGTVQDRFQIDFARFVAVAVLESGEHAARASRRQKAASFRPRADGRDAGNLGKVALEKFPTFGVGAAAVGSPVANLESAARARRDADLPGREEPASLDFEKAARGDCDDALLVGRELDVSGGAGLEARQAARSVIVMVVGGLDPEDDSRGQGRGAPEERQSEGETSLHEERNAKPGEKFPAFVKAFRERASNPGSRS